jgi:hypothetical protein
MKITLYTPDGTAETFTNVVIDGRSPEEIGFTGTDYNGKIRSLQTNAIFVMDINEAYSLPAHEVTEIFETSPLVQDNIPGVQ